MNDEENEVYYKHFRGRTYTFLSNEVTLASTVLENGNVAVGIAMCSIKDQFSRKEGRRLAFERLHFTPLKSFKLPDGMTPKMGARYGLSLGGDWIFRHSNDLMQKISELKNLPLQDDEDKEVSKA